MDGSPVQVRSCLLPADLWKGIGDGDGGETGLGLDWTDWLSPDGGDEGKRSRVVKCLWIFRHHLISD